MEDKKYHIYNRWLGKSVTLTQQEAEDKFGIVVFGLAKSGLVPNLKVREDK